jgi:glutathione S-transferase
MRRKISLWSFADVDRSGKVRWTARELGYEVEEHRLELGQHQSEAYREINPYAQVPTAEIDGEVLVESTAICILLARRHPEAGLMPTKGPEEALFWQVLGLATTTLETPVVNYLLAQRGILDSRWAELVEPSVRPRLEQFAASLPKNGFLCGGFSLADICAAYVLRVAVQGGLLEYGGMLAEYLDRLAARPAAAEARVFDSLRS